MRSGKRPIVNGATCANLINDNNSPVVRCQQSGGSEVTFQVEVWLPSGPRGPFDSSGLPDRTDFFTARQSRSISGRQCESVAHILLRFSGTEHVATKTELVVLMYQYLYLPNPIGSVGRADFRPFWLFFSRRLCPSFHARGTPPSTTKLASWKQRLGREHPSHCNSLAVETFHGVRMGTLSAPNLPNRLDSSTNAIFRPSRVGRLIESLSWARLSAVGATSQILSDLSSFPSSSFFPNIATTSSAPSAARPFPCLPYRLLHGTKHFQDGGANSTVASYCVR